LLQIIRTLIFVGHGRGSLLPPTMATPRLCAEQRLLWKCDT
jgi:hypothetical protein